MGAGKTRAGFKMVVSVVLDKVRPLQAYSEKWGCLEPSMGFWLEEGRTSCWGTSEPQGRPLLASGVTTSPHEGRKKGTEHWRTNRGGRAVTLCLFALSPHSHMPPIPLCQASPGRSHTSRCTLTAAQRETLQSSPFHR